VPTQPAPKVAASALAAAPSPIVWHVSTLPFIGIPTTTKNYYVAVNGSAANSGLDVDHPKSYRFVKDGCQNACGDTTIWMRGGNYDTVADGQLNLNLRGSGTAGSPLWIRPYQAAPYQPEHVAIRVDAGKWYSGMSGAGKYVRYVGIEWTPVAGTNLDRITDSPGSTPGPDMSHYGGAFTMRQDLGLLPDVKLIAGIFHDNQSGPSSQTPNVVDFEISDSLIYYNGWLSTADRSHGHGIYPQSGCTGTIGHRYIDNIVQHNFSYGMHFYGSSAACNNDVTIDGLDGGPTGDMPGLNAGNSMLLGGANITKRFKVTSSLFFGAGARIGYSPWPTGAITDGHVTGNVFAAELDLEKVAPNATGIDIRGNSFRDPACPPPPELCHRGYVQSDFPNNDWVTATGHGFIRPSQYIQGLAHVSIWNKGGDPVVTVSFASTGVQVGAPYEIRYAGNYYGPTIRGVYQGGDVDFPMTGWTEALPDGNISPPPSPLPYYAAFIVQQTGGVTSTPTPPK
jgi:hypothetical protein